MRSYLSDSLRLKPITWIAAAIIAFLHDVWIAEMSLWDEVRDFFEEGGGPPPDIFVDQLSNDEVELVYAWVRGISRLCGAPELLSPKENRWMPITDFANPARAFYAGDVEGVHHFFEIEVNGTAVPTLGVFVEEGALAFHYHTGKAWSAKEVGAFFEFLALIKDRCPSARIYEGPRDFPSVQFVNAFEQYYAKRPRFQRL
jgi:hypothetical protein